MGWDLSRRNPAAYIENTALCNPETLYTQSVSLRPGSATALAIDRFVKREGITGELGVSATNLETEKVIYERNHNQSFAPARIFKVITALYALERLAPTFDIQRAF